MSASLMMWISLGILAISAAGSWTVYQQGERWRAQLLTAKQRILDLERLLRAPRLPLMPLEEFDLVLEPNSEAEGTDQSP